MVINARGKSGIRELGDLLRQLASLSSLLRSKIKEIPQLTPVLFFLVVLWVDSAPSHSKSAYSLRDNPVLR